MKESRVIRGIIQKNRQHIRRMSQVVIAYHLIATTRRLTFDIEYQRADTIYRGEDDGPYFKFVASNGYEVISRSRMDIQTERLWLLGAKHGVEDRSGSMVFSDNAKRDAAYANFTRALDEWAKSHGGTAINQSAAPAFAPLLVPDTGTRSCVSCVHAGTWSMTNENPCSNCWPLGGFGTRHELRQEVQK